ncbi:MAG: YhfC family intramembrane metalloprotease [Chloroflexi bacterium]|nr:YhfC family intramembrane metalloprotease [Chloroflexota bacterium]
MTIIFFTISITLMILLPIFLAALLRRRYVVAWFLFCVGMATFIGSQVYHIPFNNWLADIGVIGPVTADDPNLWRTAVILGLSAAISETLARVIGYALIFRYKKAEAFADGVMVGLGHGGIEAMLVGGVLTAASVTALLSLQHIDLNTLDLTAEQMTAVTYQLETISSSPFIAFASLIERGAAMSLHVIVSVLVWMSFKRRNVIYLLAAVLFHALFDTLAVLLPQFTENIWLIEGVFVLLAGLGLLWLWRVWPSEVRPERHLNSLRVDLALWGTAVHKEMWQQWRTKRVLVVSAVFVLMGLASPLLAKFTPQLLQSIEGAEQFAELIPEPTTADAITQYIKNFTQFGFILVIVLGMSAVAGEKEKGTATMILSKPLPRWSFLLSKFTAQALLYLLAIMLGALGAYFYTAVLFGGLAWGPFLLGNGLLWLWVLVFTAVTLLGSAIANSTAAAAGLSFGISVLLLLAGGLPTVGAVMPSALVAWAAQLGVETAVPANGGAVAMSVVLVVVGLVTAVAFFEQQEL